MQNERDDVWNTTFYYRAVRKTLGETLSQSQGYDLSQPLPERIRTLLKLDEPSAEGVPGSSLPLLPPNIR
jgi:hypothetical protein